METRQITIKSTRTQQKYVINTDVTTLRELKAVLDDHDIDYNGLSFFEGVSQTEMINDESILPSNLKWKGKYTNDLVFLLTEPQKKIKNGAGIATRAEAYACIKKHNLGKKVEATIGKNYTRCTTAELVQFCNEVTAPAKKSTPAKKQSTAKKAATTKKVATIATRAEAYAHIKKYNLGAAVTVALGQNYTRCKTKDLIAFCSNPAQKAPTAQPVSKKVTPHCANAITKSNFTDAEMSAMFKGLE